MSTPDGAQSAPLPTLPTPPEPGWRITAEHHHAEFVERFFVARFETRWEAENYLRDAECARACAAHCVVLIEQDVD